MRVWPCAWRCALVLLVCVAGLLGRQDDWGDSDGAIPVMLAAHAAVRSRVGAPALTWSADLAEQAQRWADTLATGGRFEHEQHPGYGQNLYRISGGEATPDRVVRAWANEVRFFDAGANSCSGVCGHYTQLIWGRTQSVGCGHSRSAERDQEVWVCDYLPPGNVVGERP